MLLTMVVFAPWGLFVDMIKSSFPANMIHWAIAGSMLGQRRRRWTSIETTMAQRYMLAGFWGLPDQLWWHIVESMLANRLRRWPSIIPTLGRRPVLRGVSDQHWMLTQCWVGFGKPSTTLGQHLLRVSCIEEYQPWTRHWTNAGWVFGDPALGEGVRVLKRTRSDVVIHASTNLSDRPQTPVTCSTQPDFPSSKWELRKRVTSVYIINLWMCFHTCVDDYIRVVEAMTNTR